MDIDYSSRNLLRLSEPRFQGMGKVSPRIAVYSQARTLSPELAVRILNLTAELRLGTEVLAGLEMQRPGARHFRSHRLGRTIAAMTGRDVAGAFFFLAAGSFLALAAWPVSI